MPDDLTPDDVVKLLNQKHFLVTVGGSAYVGEWATNHLSDPPGKRLELLRPETAKALYTNLAVTVPAGTGVKRVNAVDLWLRAAERRTYRQILFSPGINGTCPADCLNLWQGFAVKPKPALDKVRLWLDHTRSVICSGDETHYEYVVKWCAHMVQRPEELPKSAIVLRGGQGTGKDSWVAWLLGILGPHAMPLHSIDQVAGRFNAHLQHVLLVFANEALWGGDKSREGLLKGLITDEIVAIEAKGKDVYHLPNFKRLIAASNKEWVVPRDHDDRRFLVLSVSDAQKENTTYFGRLRTAMANGGLPGLLHYLLNEVDLTDWLPFPVPASDDLDQKINTEGAMSAWWHECLQDGMTTSQGAHDCEWNTAPVINEVYDTFLEWCQRRREKWIPTRQQLGIFLHKAASAKTFRPWGGDRKRCYRLPELEKARECFEKHMATRISWTDETEEEVGAEIRAPGEGADDF